MLGAIVSAVSGASDGDGRVSPAQSAFSARTGDSTSYAMETLTQEKRDALIDLIVYNEMKAICVTIGL